MPDKFSSEVRSKIMSSIKGKNTKPELIIRRFLHRYGFRFRLHGKYRGRLLSGKPDIILPKYKTVIFVHGCFWHGHQNCKYFRLPKSNTEFWRWKIARNRANDIIHKMDLLREGWNVITIWECEIKYNEEKQNVILNKLNGFLRSIQLPHKSDCRLNQ
ncbi:very short patch repair endonuclease [Limibacter armeniacum]|uniref:very short patch repair endonuclease n=1 Tax=Limibacter armeniacum TaxID=466084 RepID=UPI002FE57EC2